MQIFNVNNKRGTVGMSDKNWRQKPLARAIVVASCWTLLLTSSAPLYAAPPANNTLPQAAALWLSHGNATLSTTGNNMTIDQSSAKAILNWKSFNIGKDAKVQFNQPSVNATALNLINDSSASQIFGQLGANGNIYLVNNNGILFGDGAQVNVHGLVASTLNIDTNLFINSSLPAAIASGKAALEGGTADNAAIWVAGNANITTDSGGQVLMFAPNVINAGTISTPDGQTILAASKDKVYLTASDNNPSLRGLLVEVDTGGNIVNVGKIVAERGNITLLGLAVNQSGYVRATSSVDVNGSIRLIARDKAVLTTDADVVKQSQLADDKEHIPTSAQNAVATETGTVTLGHGSLTEVAADDSGKTAADAQVQNASRVDIIAKTIELQNSSTIRAKSGKVNLVATTTPNNLADKSQGKTDSRIYLGANSVIDVSGENVVLPMSSRVIDVELRSDELKDAPLQRDGILHGATVRVDIDKGSPLISDLGPSLAKIQRGVKERMIAGGTIDMASQGDTVIADQATLNIAGGSTAYASGLENTTKLLSGNRIIDIGSADPNRKYDAILGSYTDVHPKWGKTFYGTNSFFTKGTYREGFTVGSAGGTLSIDTQSMYGFDSANLVAGVNSGISQRNAPNTPARGTVDITVGQGVAIDLATAQNIIIDNVATSALLAAKDTYRNADGSLQPLNISAAQLNNSGVGKFTLTANGTIKQTAASAIALQPAAQLSLTGTGVEIDGSIATPGGSIALTAGAPVYDGNVTVIDRYDVLLASGSALNTSGNWVNYLLNGGSDGAGKPSAVNGGSISVSARSNLTVAAGASLRADAGAQLTDTGKLVTGNGGSIALSSSDIQSRLLLGGSMSAYGFANGGKLSLTANSVELGVKPATPTDPFALWLAPDFFLRNGFSDYSLNATQGNVVVHAGAPIKLQQQNLQITDLKNAARQATNSNVRNFSGVVTLPDYLRAPVNLALTTKADNGGDVRLETGSSIVADPLAKINLTSTRNIFVDGSITALGGAIDLQISSDGAARQADPAQMIWLGANTRIDAGATKVATYNGAGLDLGTVIDAGSVDLFAKRGAIVAAPGSQINVAGASFKRDVAGKNGAVSHTTVNAAAGAISFTAANGIAVFGDLHGAAAGGDGIGGSLTYALDANDRNLVVAPTPEFNPRVVAVTNALPQWDGTLQFDTALPGAFVNRALVSTNNVRNGGFSQLTLIANNTANGTLLGGYGSIDFGENSQLNLRDSLTLGANNINLHDHDVAMTAGIISVGQQLGDGVAVTNAVAQQSQVAQSGSGTLTLAAKFIDLFGNISIGDAARVALNSVGDIRVRSAAYDNGSGQKKLQPSTFSVAGDLALQASQVYGSTLSDYTFALSGANSTLITSNSGAARTPILSAASKLTLSAPNIDIGGALLAPLGTIALNGANSVRLRDGSLLDVSANNLLIPFGRVQGGDVLWSYMIDPTAPLVIQTAPEKSVEINAPSVAMDKGARINVSGGGDIYGIEQVPGPGGSQDFLDPAYSKGAFAVVPWLNSSVAPFDFVEMAGFQVNGSGPKIGDIVYLDGAAGLPAGNYAVLPAHYALLQGAYLVTPKATDWQPGQRATQLDGTAWVSGRYGRAFTDSYDSQWLGFSVEPGSVARTRSEYNETTGDEFFSGVDTSARAADAGRVSISVTDALDLLGSIVGAAAQNGRKAQLDIIANEIEVVNTHDANSSAVQLNVAGLNGLGVDSILLGGRRSGNGSEADIAVGANNVTIRSGATLEVPDILLVAHDNITLQQGSAIAATGSSTANTQLFHIDGDGAFLRASSAAQTDVMRTNTSVPASTGVLTIAAGASVNADQSVLLDATRDMVLDGNIGLKSRSDGVVTSLNLTANRISLGDGSNAAVDGVKFSNAKLNSFNAQALRLSSRSGIDFYGDVLLDNQRVELNTGALRNMQGGVVQLRAADTLQLANTIDASDNDNDLSGGKLVLAAKNIELGNNRDTFGTVKTGDITPQKMDLFGFAQTDVGMVGTTAQLQGQGNFTLTSGGDINVVADRIGGNSGSQTAITASDTGTVNLIAAHAPVDTSVKSVDEIAAQLGAKLTIVGGKVTQGTHIDLPSGVLTLTAKGAGADDNVSLLAGSVTDVSGRSIKFPQGSVVSSDGGEVHLLAGAGNVVGAAGAKVVLGGSGDFDAATLTPTDSNNKTRVTLGGNSGLLDIVAKGQALWQAGIQALAASERKGGSLQLDVGSFSAGDFGGWLQRIADGAIDQRINIRSRSGDLTIDKNIRAADVTVSADAGNVNLAANIDASGADGGHVALWGGNNLTLESGARIGAFATAAGGRGGKVELGARDGVLTLGAASAINVAGQAGAAGQDAGSNGQVLLRAARNTSNDDVAFVDQGVTIGGADRIQLEAFKSYDASADGLVSSVIGGALSDAQVFAGDQAAIKSRIGGIAANSNFHLLSGIDIWSNGDLTLNGSATDLSGKHFGGEPGVLTLRAANNLSIEADLKDGTQTNNNSLKAAAKVFLLPDYSWNYRLVAGADTTAADPNRVTGSGDLLVKNGADIVTGAGSIALHAGGNIDVQQADSLIASLGRSLYTTYTKYNNPRTNESMPDTGSIDPYYLQSKNTRLPMYPQDGGDVDIAANGNVKFAASTSFFSSWIDRIAGNKQELGFGAIPVKTFDITTWGVLLDFLKQGTVALGGGNIAVNAGGNVVNLNAAAPTTAKQIGTTSNIVQIIGGGDIRVAAGGDVLSPRLYADRGAIDVQAGGRIGAVNVVPLDSNSLTPEDLNAVLVIADTQVNLRATGDIDIDSVLNSTAMPISTNEALTAKILDNNFFSYSDAAALSVTSTVGDVVFSNATTHMASVFRGGWARYSTDNNSGAVFAIYPGQLSATALNSNVRIDGDMTLFPSPQGQLVLLAGNNIGITESTSPATIKVNLSDTDPNGLPSLYKPAAMLTDSTNDNPIARLLGRINRPNNANLNAAVPLHVNDNQPAVIAARDGDIGVDGNLIFELAKPVRAYAGRDIKNITFAVEHSNASQISEIIAGRDILFPLQVDAEHGTFAQATDHFIRVDGPGRLDVIAGRDVDLGASAGIDAAGNTNNPALPNQGASVNVLAGINGPNALSDPVLYSQFADRYLSGGSGLTGTYIDWFTNTGLSVFSADKTSITVANLVSVFTGKKYADNNAALTDFRALPVLTQQAISLSAYETFSGAQNYAAPLISFVSLERFGGDLTAAVQAATGHSYASNAQAAAALALLPATQQQQIARSALDAASTTVRRELLLSVYSSEVRAGGVQQANAEAAQQILAPDEGYGRAYAAISQMFPGKSWQGDINLALSVVRTVGDGDINVMAPGGEVNVGLPNKIAGFNKEPKDLGIIANGYGEINGIASGSFNINQSRVFSLGNGDIMLWSSLGDVDAGKGAKTALSVEPPKVVFNSDGSSKLVYPTAVAGSGIQAGGPNNNVADRGALLLEDDAAVPVGSDTRSARLRYLKSLSKGNVYLFAPKGAINAGDAGISVAGNLLIAAQQVIGANNISVGGVSIGVPTSTSISAGTLSLGDVASSATESATNSMNDAIKQTAAALSEGGVAFVTVDIIGVGK